MKKVVANIYTKQKYARFKKGVEEGEYLLTEDLRYLTASGNRADFKEDIFMEQGRSIVRKRNLLLQNMNVEEKGTEYTQRPQMAALQPYITIIWIIRRKYI